MNQFRSIFAISFTSIVVGACSVMSVGCTGSFEPEEATPSSSIDSAEQALIDHSGDLAIPLLGEVRLETAGGALSPAPAPAPAGAGWKELAPGVWESGALRIVAGAEGHTWAIDQAENDLSDLYEDAALQAEASPAAMDAIQQKEAHLSDLKDAMQAITAPPGGTPQALSCNIGFYTGQSTPVVGSPGAAALAQVACSGGCQTFTITAQACSNFGCTPVSSASKLVCATAWTYGVAINGTPGASCSAFSSISPPGVSQSWSGFCG